MNKKLMLWIASGLAVLAIVGIGVYGVVNAQTPTPNTTPEAGYGMRGSMRGNMMGRGDTTERGTMMDRGGRMGSSFDFLGRFGTQRDEMLKVFADKLGLTVEDVTARIQAGETYAQIAESKGITSDKLSDFMKDICNEAIDASVASGKLTQEQADALKAKMQDSDWTGMWNRNGITRTPPTTEEWSGRMGMGGFAEKGGMMGLSDSWMHDELLKAFAAKVGLTVDEITAKLQAGETHAEIAESKGITGDAYTTLWKEIHTQVIDAGVAAGKLTQEQADAIKARIESSSLPMWGGEGLHGGKGGMMPFGGGRRGK